MPSDKLTAGQVKAARPRERAYKLFDGAGLYLLPTGTRSWCLAARAGLTERTFDRRFVAAAGESPARFVEVARLDGSAHAVVARAIAEGCRSAGRPVSAGPFR